jgi:hypothetical protein
MLRELSLSVVDHVFDPMLRELSLSVVDHVFDPMLREDFILGICYFSVHINECEDCLVQDNVSWGSGHV